MAKPTDKHLDVFNSCVSTSNNPIRYTSSSNIIMDAGKEFERLIGLNLLYSYPPSEFISPTLSKIEMNKLYTNKLAKIGEPARAYYDKWRSAAPNGKCPLCGVRDVNTLDHYMPKGDHPIFAIFPLNLVPACRDCNNEKLKYIANTYAEETLHPYYDSIDNVRWLDAIIIPTIPATFNFRVSPPIHWPIDFVARVENHLRVYKLYKLYSSHAAEELSNINGQLKKISIGGIDLVKSHLQDGFDSRHEANKNSWQTAMYGAMVNDDWFLRNPYY